MSRMPFAYISGPYYTYEVTKWSGPNRTILECIYVGRGKGRRGMAYYRLGRSSKGLSHRYFNPKGHNPGLDAEIAAIRALGHDIGIVAHDHGHDLAACRLHEKRLIAKHGRRDKGTGTLYNRNRGG